MSNILVIPDLHHPFTHKKALSHCIKIYNDYKCTKVISIGDIFDLYALSDYDHDPDGLSGGTETEKARDQIKGWIKAFPEMYICYGNHDLRLRRKALKSGISFRYLKALNDVFDIPNTWKWQETWRAFDVLFQHGIYTGANAAFKLAQSNRMSTVSGHSHSFAGIQWSASMIDLIYGFNVGCLIDIDTYAMKYHKFPVRPTLGAGVICDRGRLPIWIPLDLGKRVEIKI
jgi:predicted MPP superfamily phosphohydrolase